MTNIESNPRCYQVRTIPELLNQGIVGIGWSEISFAEFDTAEIAISEIEKLYGIGRRGNQIRRFYAINEGDYVVVPCPYAVAIGIADGVIFSGSNYDDRDCRNRRKVTFPLDPESRPILVPRSEFSEAFQRRLRVRGMTVNDLTEFQGEIKAAYCNINAGRDYSWKYELSEHIGKEEARFKDKLRRNIQIGKTNLLAGGTGLEKLVRELLELEGYKAEVLSKCAFPSFADADIKASRVDPCSQTDLLVQVKHHQGFSNEHGLSQLEEITKAKLSEYEDHELVFLTSASVSEDFEKRAERNGIAVIDGKGLVDWIHSHIDNLSKETKEALSICEVPTVVGD